MKFKWKYLRDSLFVNLFILPSMWLTINEMFILKHDQYALGISIIIWLMTSFTDARIDNLIDRVKDLEDK